MSDNEHVTAIREALDEAHDLTFEGDTIGIRRVLSGPRNVHLDALVRQLAEAEARPNQITVVYTCCGAQEYWPITENGELEMEHSELGATCGAYTGTYQDRMDDLRRELAEAEARAATQAQISGRIFRELMEMRSSRTWDERQAVFDRASAVLNGNEPPGSDLAPDAPGDTAGA